MPFFPLTDMMNKDMRKQPFFSIATPCWNSVSTIEKTIKSVLAQGFKDYEYIIIDGGSTDGTIDIIKKYESLFEGRMKWRSEPDNGLYDAFNKGVGQSIGVYCWNVNSDDFLEPDALKVLYEYIVKHSLDQMTIISGAMNFLTPKGELVKVMRCSYEALERAYRLDTIGINHPATIVPKLVYDKYGAFDPNYKIIGDADWYHRVYAAGVKFALIDTVITNMTDGGISNLLVYDKEIKDRLYFLRKHYPSQTERIRRRIKWTYKFYKEKLARYAKQTAAISREQNENNGVKIWSRIIAFMLKFRGRLKH